MSFLLVYVTFPDEKTAQKLSDALLENKLIACANLFPISSAYWWKGLINHENEWVAIYKTSLQNELLLQQMIEANHPYETPCIMRCEVRANEKYENWIHHSIQNGPNEIIF